MHVFLELGHGTGVVLDYFRRQLFEHVLLGSTQDERSDALFQRFKSIEEGLGFFQLFGELFDISCEILVVLFVENLFFLEKPWN